MRWVWTSSVAVIAAAISPQVTNGVRAESSGGATSGGDAAITLAIWAVANKG
jgi:hypothetical protein